MEAYRESFDLAMRIGDSPVVVAFNLGHAYMVLPLIRDLEEAERWYRHSLELRAEGDLLGRGRCLGQLGAVALERFTGALEAKKPEPEILRHMNGALGAYLKVLQMIPPDAIGDLAATHGQLGNIYLRAGILDRALEHYRQTIRYYEQAGNLYSAAQTRYNVALALAQSGRFGDAREYALAALRNYQTCGPGAADEIQKTLDLIAQIDKAAAPA